MTSGPRLETPCDESASPPFSASNLSPAVHPISSSIIANDGIRYRQLDDDREAADNA
jgi:hypothetical protein